MLIVGIKIWDDPRIFDPLLLPGTNDIHPFRKASCRRFAFGLGVEAASEDACPLQPLPLDRSLWGASDLLHMLHVCLSPMPTF